jgi:transcriptional regulator with XRE-family HTH domain
MSSQNSHGANPEAMQRQRLAELLERLANYGIRQSDAANRIEMSAQYLCDVKAGRRAMTELFARRLADEFDLDYLWLLGEQRSSEPSEASIAAAALETHIIRLPLFSHPVRGEPGSLKNWTGETFSVAGPAVAKVLTADRPYVLRFGADDRRGIIKRNDYLLISQAIDRNAEVQVLQDKSKLLLARKCGDKWETVNKDARLKDPNADRAGHCIGIVWRLFS